MNTLIKKEKEKLENQIREKIDVLREDLKEAGAKELSELGAAHGQIDVIST